MLERFRHLYHDSVRDEALRRFGLTPNAPQSLPGANHSFVYDCRAQDGTRHALKITHQSHRRAPDLLSELHFINHLADAGISAPRALQSLRGNMVEEIPSPYPNGGTFAAAAQRWAPGDLIDWRDWNPDLFAQWGELIGAMHAAAKTYQPPHDAPPRRHWHQDEDWNLNAPMYKTRPQFRNKAQQTKNWLQTLPTDPDSFGIIHSDLHQWNLHRDPATGALTPFDFDNARYDWFIADFTTVIINAVTCQQHHYHRGERQYWTSGVPMTAPQFLRHFMPPFTQGYRRRNALPPIWTRHLPQMLNRHWLTFYADAVRSPTFPNLPAQQQAANFPWRTLPQLKREALTDHWSQFTFDKYP